MCKDLGVFSIGVVLLLAGGSESRGQWTSNKIDFHGMFGQRSLGRTLTPGQSRFTDGILRGPSGNFRGRGRPEGGMMFGASTEDYWRYRQRDAVIDRPPWTAAPTVGPSDISGLPRRQLPPPGIDTAKPREAVPPPEVTPPPEIVRPPDVWFRSGSSGANTGVTAASADVRPPPATARFVARPLPPRLRVGFVGFRPVNSTGVRLALRIERCPRIQTLSPITVVAEGETAFLKGRVATDGDRLLAEDFARFEPGIWEVRNELIVGSRSLLSASVRSDE